MRFSNDGRWLIINEERCHLVSCERCETAVDCNDYPVSHYCWDGESDRIPYVGKKEYGDKKGFVLWGGENSSFEDLSGFRRIGSILKYFWRILAYEL